jgi:hypothetical protein
MVNNRFRRRLNSSSQFGNRAPRRAESSDRLERAALFPDDS